MSELRRIKVDALIPLSENLVATGKLPNGWNTYTEVVGPDCDIDLIVKLADRAATFLPPDQMDPWLAPRLHNALRIPRRLACDDAMWAWLAFQCQAFVEARFKRGNERLHPWRYRGVWSRNAIGRLWWGAEMTRNGPDYKAVELVFRRTRTAQFALELMYSWDRAAAIAFATVAEGADGQPKLSDSETNALSTRLRVYLTLRSLDALAESDTGDTEEFDALWAAHHPSFATLVRAEVGKLEGPSSGTCSASRVKQLSDWFRLIATEPGSPGPANSISE